MFGFALVLIPFLLCLGLGYTFAPVDSLVEMVAPFTDWAAGKFPQTHFWHDTVAFYWPRLATISRHEFPISFASDGGLPVYADTISGYFSPFVWATIGWMGASHRALILMWALQYAVLYCGLYLWLRQAGASKWGSTIGALTHTFATCYLVGSYLSFQSLGAMSCVPLAIWSAGAFPKAKWRYVLPPLLLALSILSGNLQTGIYPLVLFFGWALVSKRYALGFFVCSVAVLLTLPFWLTGIEYHILQNQASLAGRQSAMPKDLLGKFKALMALPAVFLPELYGSTKSVDFLKVFKTSATYFVGSMGLIAPLVILSVKKASLKALWSKSETKFAVALIVGSIVIMASPLLSFFYYRVLCLICLGLSILLAFAIEEVDERKLTKFCRGALVLLAVFSAAFIAAKLQFGAEMKNFLTERLAAGTHYWWPEWQAERVQRWLTGYLSDFRFFSILVLLAVAPVLYKLGRVRALAAVVFLDCVLLNMSQFTLNKAVEPRHDAFHVINDVLKRSPMYPLSRFSVAGCGSGRLLFEGAVQEYVGANATSYYGSTSVPGISRGLPPLECDMANKVVRYKNSEALDRAGVNVLVLRKGWTINGLDFEQIHAGKDYAVWARRDLQKTRAVWGLAAGGAPVFPASQVTAWSHSRVNIQTNWNSDVTEWSISLPHYPGWQYTLDGVAIKPDRIEQSVPVFKMPVTTGVHVIEAKFVPQMLLWGLGGTTAGFVAMVIGAFLL